MSLKLISEARPSGIGWIELDEKNNLQVFSRHLDSVLEKAKLSRKEIEGRNNHWMTSKEVLSVSRIKTENFKEKKIVQFFIRCVDHPRAISKKHNRNIGGPLLVALR